MLTHFLTAFSEKVALIFANLLKYDLLQQLNCLICICIESVVIPHFK